MSPALPGDRCALTVGDVTGHDIRAAAVMGQLRTATHTLATLDLTPAETLTRLDQLTADLTDEETSATCIYAVHDSGHRGLGHRPGRALPCPPWPALAAPPFSSTCPLACPSAPASASGHYQATRLHVPQLQHTGPVHRRADRESRGADMSAGMARLADAVTTTGTPCRSARPATPCGRTGPRPLADDIAVLMART